MNSNDVPSLGTTIDAYKGQTLAGVSPLSGTVPFNCLGELAETFEI